MWRDKDNEDEPYRSCTIITWDASEGLKDKHDRIPVVLPPNRYEAWLDHNNHDTKRIQEILSEETVNEFEFRPVSKQVNSVRVNEPSNIATVSE
jgi:putative SOS response-associated peptidase YedK